MKDDERKSSASWEFQGFRRVLLISHWSKNLNSKQSYRERSTGRKTEVKNQRRLGRGVQPSVPPGSVANRGGAGQQTSDSLSSRHDDHR